MPLIGLCASHTPLKDRFDPGAEVRQAVDAAIAEVRDWVAAFAPDLVVMFGPDHFNGFFYRLMPSFCIGAVADSLGDWGTPAGPLPVATGLVEELVPALHEAGIDVAMSYRMEVDHGLAQGLQLLFPWEELPPVIPVFINCAAPPRPPMASATRTAAVAATVTASAARASAVTAKAWPAMKLPHRARLARKLRQPPAQ